MSENSVCYLVHHERLDLPLEDLHAGCGDHRADVRHYDLTEDVADEPVVPLEASGCRVLHGKTVVVVWTEEIKFIQHRTPNHFQLHRLEI